MIMPRVMIKSDGADEFIALVSRVTAVNAVKQQRGAMAMMFAVTIMSFAIEGKKILTDVSIQSCQWQWQWQELINHRLSVGLWQKLHKTSESEVLNIIECLSTTAITLSLQLNSSTISDHKGEI